MIKTENTAEKKENAADVCAAECAAEIKAHAELINTIGDAKTLN